MGKIEKQRIQRSEQEYRVDQIVFYVRRGNRMKFIVRWNGYTLANEMEELAWYISSFSAKGIEKGTRGQGIANNGLKN